MNPEALAKFAAKQLLGGIVTGRLKLQAEVSDHGPEDGKILHISLPTFLMIVQASNEIVAEAIRRGEGEE